MKTLLAALLGAAVAVFILAPMAFPATTKKRHKKPILKIVSSK
jgi:hypothetical protein